MEFKIKAKEIIEVLKKEPELELSFEDFKFLLFKSSDERKFDYFKNALEKLNTFLGYDIYKEMLYGDNFELVLANSDINSEYFEDIKCIDSYGGENCGTEMWSIWEIPYLNIFVKFQGSYYSHDGAYFHNIILVYPREVTKIEYLPNE